MSQLRIATGSLGSVARARQALAPLHVLFELTYRCNVRCVHCYLAGRERELTIVEISGILDQLAAAGTLILTLSGGEILLRRDFFEIAEAARARGFALRLFTNGTLVTPVIADKIAALTPVLVEMSLLGATAAVHDAVTLKAGSFNKTLRAVRLLSDRGVRVKLKTTLMNSNIDEAQAMEALAKGLGVEHQVSFIMMPRRDGDQSPVEMQIDDRALKAYLRRRQRDLDEAPIKVENDDEGLCSAGRAACSISPSGDVYPCVLMPVKAGNLLEFSFDEIWRDAPALRNMRALVDKHKIACQGCDDETHSFCPALNLLQMGDMTTASPQLLREQEFTDAARIEHQRELISLGR